MTTFVGTQSHFVDALKELIELDFDAIEAYEAAINRLENENFKIQLQKFESDHQRHVQELNNILAKHNEDIVEGPCAKKWLTQGKVVIGNLIGGDQAILRAMLDNEEDTNTAYAKVNSRDDIWPDALDALKRGLADEKRHKIWIKENIK